MHNDKKYIKSHNFLLIYMQLLILKHFCRKDFRRKKFSLNLKSVDLLFVYSKFCIVMTDITIVAYFSKFITIKTTVK